jgi:serine/threonine protein kinase
MLGTHYYMSPEQAQGTKSVDFRSDLWSLGVIVYQCATGLLPFESEALGDLLMKIIVNPLPVPSQVADVPIGFDAWWAKAAARDPAARFQSAKDFADALGLVCGISQVSGVTDRAEVYGVMGGTPHRGALGMATPPGGGPEKPLAGTTGGSMVQTYNYGDDANGLVPKKKIPIGVLAIGGAVVAAAVVAGVIVSMRGKPVPASSASSPLPAETTAQTASAAPTAPTTVPAAETLAPPTLESPPTVPAAASAAIAQGPKGTTHGTNAASAARPPPGGKPAAPGPKQAAPAKGDLGF